MIMALITSYNKDVHSVYIIIIIVVIEKFEIILNHRLYIICIRRLKNNLRSRLTFRTSP